MCRVCGCGEGETTIEGREHHHDAHHRHYGEQAHGEHIHDYGQGPAHAHAPGMSQSRMVQIEQDILSRNNQYAATNRNHFASHGILVLNLLSSPGSGKTTLLTKSLTQLQREFAVAVIEGDQQTARDAERIRATGVKVVQINTGRGCHLDAHMVGHAVESLQPEKESILFIENVGNLICPAAFDLGEAHKVAILSVTEGEDKPLKYPDMFHAADLILLNKIDLLPHLDFSVEQCIENARRINPGIKVLQLSATTGEGMDGWLQWLNDEHNLLMASDRASVEG